MIARLLLVTTTLTALVGCTDSVRTLETALASHDSATHVLNGICAERQPAGAPPIRAEHAQGGTSPDASDPQARLAPGPDEPLRLRHMRLTCEDETLSEAWNWYVPARLPEEANAQLDEAGTPFGRALAQYGFTRTRLWSRKGRAGACPAGTILSQAAELHLPGQDRPVSYVLECYTRAALGGS